MSKIEVNTVDAQCGSTITVGSSGKNVKIEGNDIRSNDYKASDAGNIISQSGTTITIGASGDTINLASGASQSGFGRTGTVDWQTAIKTATLTAASGEGYFCNTSGGAFTVNLPSSPTVGDIVAVKDYAGTFDTNNLTLGRGGSNIEGLASDKVLSTESLSITFVYADATKGWLAVNDMAASQVPKFVAASGGTEVTCGDFKIHKFTGPGTFCVSSVGNPIGSTSVDYLVVAGGGGGSNPPQGAGGGAGGFRSSNSTCMPGPQTSPLANPTGVPVSVQGYPITVGSGGSACGKGNNSIFSTITSAGGGSGAAPTASGGSGGGDGGNGNTPPVSPPQGNNGGGGNNSGGGGAAAAGGNFTPPKTGGVGGAGSFMVTTGFVTPGEGTPGPVSGAKYFAGGGAGGYPVGSPSGAPGGVGGGGTGAEGGVGAGNGTANTGGGGGGGGPGGTGTGGSGMVIIRYKFQ